MKLLSHYDDHHTHPINRALHMIAIPLGFSSVVVIWWHPIIGLLLIPAALLLATLGHVIEGNQPAFMKDPKAILIAPVWLFKFLTGKMRKSDTAAAEK
ncbi:MAG: Mpo1-like protein [Terriglobales bacterium]